MLDRFLNLYMSTHGTCRLFLRALWELIRRVLILLGDPSYLTSIRGQKIRLPVSHKLPIYVANNRYYDELPSRVSTYLHKREQRLVMIDVGANIGDTILSSYQQPEDCFLAVEVNHIFIEYLKQNCEHIANLDVVRTLCSSEDRDVTSIKITVTDGTAKALEDQKGMPISKRTLDTILVEKPQFSQCNFLKTDTDGSDFDVIRGAHDLISRRKPMVLMECDVFNNTNYVADFYETMKFFLSVGYDTLVVYDNFGFLVDIFALQEYARFKFALLHQLMSKSGYFDLLILDQSHKEFAVTELAYFADTVADQDISKIVESP